MWLEAMLMGKKNWMLGLGPLDGFFTLILIEIIFLYSLFEINYLFLKYDFDV